VKFILANFPYESNGTNENGEVSIAGLK